MRLISPVLYELLNSVLPSVSALQNVEKPEPASCLCSCPAQAPESYRRKRILLVFCLDVYAEWELVFQAKHACWIGKQLEYCIWYFVKCLVKQHRFHVGANCSAGLHVYREVFIWLGAPKSTITSTLPFSSTLCFPSEQKNAKCHLKSLVSPALVKPPLPGQGHLTLLPPHKISGASSSVFVWP